MKKLNKKQTIGLIAVIISLVVLILGATYAYFAVPTIRNFNSINSNVSVSNLGNVSLTNTNTNLSINLSVSNFGKTEYNDITYYASSSGTTTIPTNEVIGTVTSVGPGTYACHYTMTITKTSINDLYTAFQNMATKSTNQIILQIDDTEYDFNTANLFNNFTHTGIIRMITDGYPKNITASLRIINRKDVIQNDINGKDITLSFNVTSFTCDATGEGGKTILASNPANLSATPLNDLLGENTLYRYQGTASNVNNNYICFGTSDMETCKNNQNTYMYRILGITEDGKIKVIKKTSITHQWNNYTTLTDCNTYGTCTWGLSSLHNDLNSTWYLNNTTYFPSVWADKILNIDWKYGINNSDGKYSASSMFNVENSFTDIVKSKIGLMYIYDYYYANNWDGTQNYGTEQSPVRYGTDGWIHISNNQENDYEWAMLRFRGLHSNGVSVIARRMNIDGSVELAALSNNHCVRPVFYIVSDVIINGAGTETNPYIISS